MSYKFNPLLGIGLGDVGATEQDVQDAVQAVEGTASVVTTASATLPADSTGPVAVSLADADFLAVETSIKGLLGTLYGTLSRAADGSYSFTSEQSYSSTTNFTSGTRFATAALPNTFNPLRVGNAELEEALGYAETGYVYTMLDVSGRIAWGVKADGSIVINKVGSLVGAFSGTFTGDLAGDLTGDLTGDVDADEIRVNKLIAPGGGTQSGDPSFQEFYSYVVLDSADRIAYGVRPDGTVQFSKQITVGDQPLAVRPDSLAGGPLGLFESRSDGTSHQIYRYFNGSESQLTSGSNNYNISLTSETPERVLFYSDRDGAPNAYVMDADGSDVYYANALSNIAIWGDSMSADLTEARMQSGLAAIGAAEPDRDVWNLGIGGQSSLQVASRMGAIPWTAEIVGGVIPASGQVQITNHRTPLWTQFFDDYPTASADHGDNFQDYGSWLSSPGKDTYVEIAGVKGRIYRTDSAPNPDTYVFERLDPGLVVNVSNPVDINVVEQALVSGYPTPTSITTLASYTSILWPFGPHITNYILDGEGNNIAGQAIADLEMAVVDAMVKKLGSLNKKFILLNEAKMTPAHSLEENAMRNKFVSSAIAAAYTANYPDNYLNFTPYFLSGGLGVPSFKSWFAANYPAEYAAADTGWAAEMNTYLNNPANATVVYTETRAAATVTLTGNGGSGVSQNYVSVETVSPPDTSKQVEVRDQSRVGLRLGVNASGGVVASLWVREGGIGYVAGDTFTIPAGTIGNTSDITGTVATTRSETIGTVRNEDGTVDVANSYSQWDVDNGYIPRSARRDIVHFNGFGAEYLCLVLAAKVKSLNW